MASTARRNRRELDDFRARLRYQLDSAATKYEGEPEGETVQPVLNAVRAWVGSPGDFTLVQLLHVATSPAPHRRPEPDRSLALSAPGMWTTSAHP